MTEFNQDENTKALVNIQTKEKTSLSDFSISDSQLNAFKIFSELTVNDEPIEELPPDKFSDIMYDRSFASRCNLCKAPEAIRNRIEHEWLAEGGRNTSAVVAFVLRYYNAKINWACINTHMLSHCRIEEVPLDNLTPIVRGRVGQHLNVVGREGDLARNIVLDQIQVVAGIKVAKKPELAIKVAQMMDRFVDKLLKMQQYRDNIPTDGINIFAVLHDLLGKLKCTADREVLINFVGELQNKIHEQEK